MEKSRANIAKTDVKGQGDFISMKARPEVKSEPDGRIITDPFGSWTGTPVDDIFDTPVQDVDDL